MRKLVLFLAACVACSAIAPASASASYAGLDYLCTFDYPECSIHVTGLPGEANDITVTWNPETKDTVVEDQAGIVPDPVPPAGFDDSGCYQLTPTSVRCVGGLRWVTNVRLELGDQNDQARLVDSDPPGALKGQFFGGTGDDVLIGSNGLDSFVGNAGADRFVGGSSSGDMTFDGLRGVDRVLYSDRNAGVNAIIGGGPVSGNAADGPKGARDQIDGDIEDVVGGAGDDLLKGSPASNRLDGRAGNDRIVGRKGADLLFGWRGEDRLKADDGERDITIDCDDAQFPSKGDRAVIDRKKDPKPVGCERVKKTRR